MLKILYAGCLGFSPAISAQFILKMCIAARNRETFIKIPYFGGLRSFKVIRSLILIVFKSPLPVLVMISSMFVSICNRFYARRANTGKKLSGVSLSRSRLTATPSSRGKILSHKTEFFGQFTVKIS